jgi:3-oxoacyl-[acyl-carrier-protein] synthase II
MVTYASVRDGITISGLGCVSSLGCTTRAFEERLLAGESGIRPIARFDVSRCRARQAATIDGFNAADYITPAKLRRIDAVGRVALAATRLALEDAALDVKAAPDRIGLVLGSCTAGVHTTGEYLESLMKGGPTGAPALLFANTVGNAAASLCGLEFGLRGPNTTINHKESSGAAALAFAVQLLRLGKADAILAGGADDIYQHFFVVHDWFGVLSSRDGRPEGSRPFDITRNGFVMGEGGFMLALERRAPAAVRRKADPTDTEGEPAVYGEIVGVGAAGSSEPINAGPTNPAPLARTMRLALEDAGCAPEDIGAVYGSANSTVDFDRVEADAIASVFGDDRVPVTSIKRAIGEFGGAAVGSIVAALLCGRRGVIAPTTGCASPDPACRIAVVQQPLPLERPLVLVNSFASGGTHYSLVVRTQISAH